MCEFPMLLDENINLKISFFETEALKFCLKK